MVKVKLISLLCLGLMFNAGVRISIRDKNTFSDTVLLMNVLSFINIILVQRVISQSKLPQCEMFGCEALATPPTSERGRPMHCHNTINGFRVHSYRLRETQYRHFRRNPIDFGRITTYRQNYEDLRVIFYGVGRSVLLIIDDSKCFELP